MRKPSEGKEGKTEASSERAPALLTISSPSSCPSFSDALESGRVSERATTILSTNQNRARSIITRARKTRRANAEVEVDGDVIAAGIYLRRFVVSPAMHLSRSPLPLNAMDGRMMEG